MQRSVSLSVLVVVAAVALAAGFFAAVMLRGGLDAVTAENAVDVVLPDLEGQVHRLSDWRGKTLLVNFWATWCGPCREEIPLLKEMQAIYGHRGLQVVGIAIDDPSEVAIYNRKLQMNYPILIGDADSFQLMTRYGNTGGALPYSVIFAPNGQVISRKLGAYRASELEASLESALSSAQPHD